MYPPGWPKCPTCGDPTLDGKATCGRAECSPENLAAAMQFAQSGRPRCQHGNALVDIHSMPVETTCGCFYGTSGVLRNGRVQGSEEDRATWWTCSRQLCAHTGPFVGKDKDGNPACIGSCGGVEHNPRACCCKDCLVKVLH